jgi:aspartate/methionine/tyrosine aminotransferase
MDVADFCTDLVEKKGVMLLPSTVYGYGHSHFRIGLGRENMPEGLEQLEQYLRNLS